jgi:CRISPR-associated protein Cas2
MFVVVSYDIPDDRRRTRVMKALKDFGAHVQYSVFECELSAEDYRRMRERLIRLIDRRKDSLRFYVLCETSKSASAGGSSGWKRTCEAGIWCRPGGATSARRDSACPSGKNSVI